MSYAVADRPLWVPSPERVAAANITAFSREAEARWGRQSARLCGAACLVGQ
jgi:hypothetical protein